MVDYSHGDHPALSALEAVGLEACRERRITGYQLRMLLGIGSRFELDGLLKQHQVEKYNIDDFESDLATIRQMGQGRQAEPNA